MDDDKMTLAALQQMKQDGRKIVGVVAYDYQMAQIVERARVDIVAVGDSVGVNLWGHKSELEVTLDQMVVVCQAVRRGVTRALVSCDFPFGPLQKGPDAAVRAAIRLVKEGGADLVEIGRRIVLSRGGPRHHSRGHSGVGAVRYHASHGLQVRAARVIRRTVKRSCLVESNVSD
jgi:hypothetical protein